jgi:hypothetical protein
VFLLNSRLRRFSAAHLRGHPLSRSYGVILPSSFSVNHSSPLGCSPRPPVSDYGTVNSSPGPRSFSWQRASIALCGTLRSLRHRLSTNPADLPTGQRLPALQRIIHPPAGDPAPASLLGLVTAYCWYRNVDLFPIVYASRPRLRDRLTLS